MPIKTEDQVSRRIRDLYERALSAVDRDNPSLAIELLLDAIALEPEFLQAHKLLRATQKKQFGAKGAMAYVKKGAAMFGTLHLLGMGWAQLKEKPKQAMIAGYKMLNQDPTNTQGLDLIIRASQALEIYEVAVLAAEAAVTASPNNVSFLTTLASLYRQAGQPHKALDVYERALEVSPNDPDIIREVKETSTEAHMVETNIEDAKSSRDMLRDAKQVVSLEQESKVVRSEDALKDLIEETLVKIDQQPDNMTLRRKLADLYVQKNDFEKAQTILEEALKKENADPSLEKMLGDLKIKRVDVRIKPIRSALEQKPNDPLLTRDLNKLLAERESLVLAECENRVRRYPNDIGFRFELANIYFRMGQIEKALPEFQQSTRSPQCRVQALNFLGLCFRHQKLYDLALNQLQKADVESPIMDNVKKDVIYNLGETYEMMGKPKEALDQFKRIYEVDIGFRDVQKKIIELGRV
jgi:tetratricopeptide (TPR) repeat protein